MSELIEQNSNCATAKLQLLTGVCTLALIGNVTLPNTAAAGEPGRPTFWIELGAQLERMDATQGAFSPAFAQQFASDGFLKPGQLERAPRYSNGIEGTLTFSPRGTDWTFDVSMRYGRSSITKVTHRSAPLPVLHAIIDIPAFGIYFSQSTQPMAHRQADGYSHANESHTVLDFQAGHDVGLGLFRTSSTVDLGVRVAQFNSRSQIRMTANPGGSWTYKYALTAFGQPAYIHAPLLSRETWNLYHANATVDQSFRGIGPSLSFNDSIPLVGIRDAMEAKLDFGINGAILFGRQKVHVHHATSDDTPLVPLTNFVVMTPVYRHAPPDRASSHLVVVPNIGGFAGLSFNYANAKLKLGYRADFFFGAMDGGIDTRKTYDRNFYGPFATVSIGLGG